MKIKIFLFSMLCALALPYAALAHENYVLPKEQIEADMKLWTPHVLDSLKDPGNLRVGLAVAVGSLLGIIVYFFFFHSRTGQAFDAWLRKFEPFGHVALRVALAASLLASAYFHAFLGPEIPSSSLPFGSIMPALLAALGILILLGFWIRVVSAISLVILILSTWIYKDYMLTYFNYFGEFLALLLFGSSTLALDNIFRRGGRIISDQAKDWEIAIIRITYGLSVLYPAITIKLLHPQVMIDIVEKYNLTQFHWLFPHDPLLISLGTGLAQVAVGICLVIGFETRLNTLVTFGLMVLSVFYFKEAVWPHYILLALALYLFINNGGKLGIDGYISSRREKMKSLMLKKVLHSEYPSHS